MDFWDLLFGIELDEKMVGVAGMIGKRKRKRKRCDSQGNVNKTWQLGRNRIWLQKLQKVGVGVSGSGLRPAIMRDDVR